MDLQDTPISVAESDSLRHRFKSLQAKVLQLTSELKGGLSTTDANKAKLDLLEKRMEAFEAVAKKINTLERKVLALEKEIRDDKEH